MNHSVAIYIRVSTEQQAKEGYSIAAQKNNLCEFARKHNWNIYDIYSDEGISGKSLDNRPEINRLISDIKCNKIDKVLLYKFDRLTRSSVDTEDIINILQNYPVEIYTLSGGTIDVNSASGRFKIRLDGIVAQLEREQTIERVKVAFEQKVRDGYTLACSNISYGYNRKKGQKIQTINKKEAPIVIMIYKMFNSGKTINEIANYLNINMILTKNHGKKRKISNNSYTTINSIWQSKTVRNILTNPTYIGKVRYGVGRDDGFIADGKHKGIIDHSLWNNVQLKIKLAKKDYVTKRPKDDCYFYGIIKCRICNKNLKIARTVRIISSGERKEFCSYRCINNHVCNCSSISHKKLNQYFENYLNKKNKQMLKMWKKMSNYDRHIFLSKNIEVIYFLEKEKKVSILFYKKTLQIEEF